MRNLIVERETFKSKDGKDYYGYFVKGNLRGREFKAELMPKNKDYDGYGLLDLIFDIAPTAQLIIKDEVTESASGVKSKYMVYEVSNTDEDGIEYSYKVKPRAESDKSVIDVLLQQLRKQEQAQEV